MSGRNVTVAVLTVLLAGCASQSVTHSGSADYRAYEPREPRSTDARVSRYHDARGYAYRDASPTATEVRSSSEQPYAGARGTVVPAQAAGALVGGLLGAQVGRGNGRLAATALGAAAGAYGVGKAADPCQPDLNAGHAIGGVAGGLLGSMVGSGRGRSLATALGAATGAIAGGNVASSGACR